MNKYKLLSTGNVVRCDGGKHYYPPLGIQPTEALCWCHLASPEQLARWAPSEAEARAKAQTLGSAA